MGNYSSAAMAAFAAAMANNNNTTESFNDTNTQTELDEKTNRCKSSDNNFLSTNTAAAIASSIMAAAAASAASNNHSTNVTAKHSIKLCRRRKARTVFSDQQLNGLEKRFESQKYLSTPERVELANSLGLSETQVNIIQLECLDFFIELNKLF